MLIKIVVLLLILIGGSAFAASPLVLQKHNTVSLNTYIDYDTIAGLEQQVKKMDAMLGVHEPIYLVIDSGGGGIDAGFELVTNMFSALGREVHTVSIFAASMAFQTVQALKTRYITSTGTLMTHKASGGFHGEFPGQLDSRYLFWLRRVELMDQVTVKRTKGLHTLESYRALSENEYWCTGEDCVKQGFADEVVNVHCAGSLSGEKEVIDQFLFRGFRVSLKMVNSECPLISGPLKVDVTINGRTLFTSDDKEYYDWEAKKMTNPVIIPPELEKEIIRRTGKKSLKSRVVDMTFDEGTKDERDELKPSPVQSH